MLNHSCPSMQLICYRSILVPLLFQDIWNYWTLNDSVIKNFAVPLMYERTFVLVVSWLSTIPAVLHNLFPLADENLLFLLSFFTALLIVAFSFLIEPLDLYSVQPTSICLLAWVHYHKLELARLGKKCENFFSPVCSFGVDPSWCHHGMGEINLTTVCPDFYEGITVQLLLRGLWLFLFISALSVMWFVCLL